MTRAFNSTSTSRVQSEFRVQDCKMWFNILPAYFIVFGSLGLPGLGLWWAHYALLGNHYRRSMNDRWDRRNYQRDMRLTGNPYNVNGLDSIPDEK